MHRLAVAVLAALLVATGIPATPARAASTAKVVIVVGPVGGYTAHYKDDAADIAAEARRYTSDVTTIATPNATWARVRAAMQGANVFVYLGHGNGWPSIYAPFQMQTKDGLGLDPSTGADGVKTVYYGEDYLRQSVRLAPNAAVLLYHLCYASGNTEPGLATGSFADSRERVDNYGAGFIGAGARIVLAEGHPNHPATNYIRQLFTTDRSMESVFRSHPTFHDNVLGPYASQRTPGLRFLLDPDTDAPSGFYRSAIGDLALRTTQVVGPQPASTGTHPADFVVPGAAEVTAAGGAPLFASAAAAADPAATAATTLPVATRLRVTAEAPAAADGTRVLAVTALDGTSPGFVRAPALAPRDSAPVELWTFDQSAPTLSPNDDNVNDDLLLAPRFSEVASVALVVKNAGGTTVRTLTATTDIARLLWDLRTSTGTPVPDGTYTWAMSGRDAWGNGSVYVKGSFVVDRTPPVTTATPAATTGTNGWITAPVQVTLAATDGGSGVRTTYWRVDGGTAQTWTGTPAVVRANGIVLFEYRSVDRAGVREDWKDLTFRIDTLPPAISVATAGTAGATAGTWRGPVTLTPAFSDPASGVATRTVAVDGADPVAYADGAVALEGEGTHTVTFAATDAAGNAGSVTVTAVIDTVAPAIVLPAALASAGTATVTPNGDGRTDSVSLPYSISEAATVSAVVTDAAGTKVRAFSQAVAGGDVAVTWDGRNASGTPVKDGAYAITLTPRDPAGNVGAPASIPVDVYAALAKVARTPTAFFPQDGDAIATRSAVSWTLRSAATVTLRVTDAAGAVVRTGYAQRALAAGTYTWTWNGRRQDGTWAPRGTYRVTVSATNGVQAASQALSIVADAFVIGPSVTTAVRGTAFTVTVRTVEPLSTTPYLVVAEPGLTARKVALTKTGTTTWKATITPRTSAAAGTMSITAKAFDSRGGLNTAKVSLALK